MRDFSARNTRSFKANPERAEFSKPQIGKTEKVLFSFRLLDISGDYYNLSGVCDKGLKNLMEALNELSQINAIDLRSGKYTSGKFRFHQHGISEKNSHDWPDIFSKYSQLEQEFYQFHINKSRGVIHGTFIDNVFYIIWFDPHHWYYHDSSFGPKHKLKHPGDCCKHLEDTIKQQHEKIVEYEKMLEEITNPL